MVQSQQEPDNGIDGDGKNPVARTYSQERDEKKKGQCRHYMVLRPSELQRFRKKSAKSISVWPCRLHSGSWGFLQRRPVWVWSRFCPDLYKSCGCTDLKIPRSESPHPGIRKRSGFIRSGFISSPVLLAGPDTHDCASSTMHIPQDVVELIIDQLALVINACREMHPVDRDKCLQATSLVSTAWVNPSQRHLFSTTDFNSGAEVQKWCSRTRPGPYGISRHVRTLRLWRPSLVSDILETAIPHFTSFRNLRELNIGGDPYLRRVDINRASPDLLAPIFSSFAGTLKRLQWTQKDTTHETWKSLYILTDLLPNLMDLDLTGYHYDGLPVLPPVLPRIHLSSHNEPPDPLAFKHFKFHELKIMKSIPPSPPFFEYCQTHLRVLDLWGWSDIEEPGCVSP